MVRGNAIPFCPHNFDQKKPLRPLKPSGLNFNQVQKQWNVFVSLKSYNYLIQNDAYMYRPLTATICFLLIELLLQIDLDRPRSLL